MFQKKTLEMFLWTRRNEFWEYQTLSKIVLCAKSGRPRSLGCLCLFQNFQPFHFQVISHPPPTKNITALLRLLFYFAFILEVMSPILPTIETSIAPRSCKIIVFCNSSVFLRSADENTCSDQNKNCPPAVDRIFNTILVAGVFTHSTIIG